MDYLPWIDDINDDGYAWIIDEPPEIDEPSYLIHEEASISHWWPEEVVFDLSPDYGVRLADYVPTVTGLHIISKKLKEILDSECQGAFDFYPVTIRNQKGRIVKASYYLAHLRIILDCMDREKSDFTINPINTEHATRIRRLVLREDKIPDNIKIFALKEDPSLWLVQRELAKNIYREFDCRGMLFIKLENYGIEWRTDG